MISDQEISIFGYLKKTYHNLICDINSFPFGYENKLMYDTLTYIT